MKKRYEIRQVKERLYTVDYYLDYFNERLRITDYRGNLHLIIDKAVKMSITHSFTKIIFYAKPEDWHELLMNGFVVEAVFKDFFNGTDCYAMCYYLELNRRTSKFWTEEDDILTAILNSKRANAIQPIPESYSFRMAKVSDVQALASLYRQVFAVYPTPMNDPEYIRDAMNAGNLFMVAEHNKTIVSVASADINQSFHHAELTDCATLPDHRKYGLMKKLLQLLEDELIQGSIYCAFSIARALSYGMNAAFYQLGYQYTGRLINNCYIFDKIEDMNVWVKDFSRD